MPSFKSKAGSGDGFRCDIVLIVKTRWKDLAEYKIKKNKKKTDFNTLKG